MLKIASFLLLMLFAAGAFTEGFVDGIAEFLCQTVFNDEEYEYSDHFSSTFIEEIPEQQLRGIVNEAMTAAENCQRVEILTTSKHAATVLLISVANNSTRLSFSVDADGRINGLMIIDV